jgi:plasmid stabilization system protein ParE
MANRKLVLTSDAKNDLFEIVDYLAENDTEQTLKFISEVNSYLHIIQKNNYVGKKSNYNDLYLLEFENSAYSLVYFVNDFFVRIMGIFSFLQVSDKVAETLMKLKNSEFIKIK